MNKEKQFNGYSNVIKYLVNEMGIKPKWYRPFQLNLQNIQSFKDELKKKHTLNEIKVLKTDLEGINGQLRLFSTFIASVAVTISILGLIINNSNTVFKQNNDSMLSISEKVLQLQYVPFTNEELRQRKLDILLKSIENMKSDLHRNELNMIGLTIIAGSVIASGYIYYSRTRRVAVLYNNVSHAYDEKKEEEEALEIKIMNKKIRRPNKI